MTQRKWQFVFTAAIAVTIFPLCDMSLAMAGVPRQYRMLIGLALSCTIAVVVAHALRRLFRWRMASVDVGAFFTHTSSEKTVLLSHVESMIAAGDAAKATTELEALIARHGLDERLCVLTVNFHLDKLGDSRRAESLLRRMRIENSERFERYATSRLIDLYMSSSETYPKALTELQRLIARFPGSVDAKGAQACVERLRAHSAMNVKSSMTAAGTGASADTNLATE